MSDNERRDDLTQPPNDFQAEQAVLGSILKSPRSIHQVLDWLVPETFYDVRHQLIYAAAGSLARQDVPVDYHNLDSELQRQGTYERAGGLLYLSEINLATPTAAHIEYYGKRVADHYVRRQAIQVHQTGAEIAWRASVPVDDMLAMSQAAILRLSDQPGARVKSSTAGEAIERWLEGFTADRPENDRGDRIVGHSTGLRCLDKITLGLQPARLYLLPAYTSVGKSQLAHQVALHVARHHGPVLMVSLEMSDQELTTRAIAMESGIPAEALATHEIDDREAAAVLEVVGRQQADPLHYMDGSDGLTTSQIRSRALQLQAQHSRLALIVIDYGQLLQDSKGNNSTVEDQTLVSRNLKRMARALDVPLLVPVQINRQAGARGDQRPKLSDIRESGCVTGDTRLLRADTGEPVEIGQLVRNGWEGVQVWSLDDHGKMRAAPVTRVFASGTKPVFQLRLSSGRSVKASANHRFLTLDGWVELGCLRPGARLAIPRTIPESVGAATAWNPVRLGLLAHLTGDGCALPTQPLHYTNADQDNLLFHGVRQQRLTALLARLHDVSPNPNVDTLPLEAWAWVKAAMRESGLSSRALAAGLGVACSESAFYKAAPSRARMARLNQVLGSRRLAGLLEDDIFWDTVVSIDPLGDQPVFDATVEGTHNFIADGVVAHNSWEQDADVVVGLYRDELVHPDSDQHGMLELIVLKNRHSGQRPPFTAKAVWHRGRYWEWDRNSYADRTRVPRGVAAAFDGRESQPARLSYSEEL